MKLRKKREVLAEFAGHLVVGLLLFAFIAAAAVGLAFVVLQIEHLAWAVHIAKALSVVEHVMLGADCFLLLWWVCTTTFRAAKELL